jgi:fructose-1,6-bisphosphatase
MRYVQCGAGLLAIAHKVIIPYAQIICAGYCDYGSATELVLTYGHGVERYTLDPSIGKCVGSAFSGIFFSGLTGNYVRCHVQVSSS